MKPIINWEEVKTAYVTGNESLQAIAKAFCVSPREIYRNSKSGNWVELKEAHHREVAAKTRVRIVEEQIQEQMKLYDKARNAADKIISLIEGLSLDPDAFYLHAIQREQSCAGDKDKWVEDKLLKTVNGKNLADVAKALTSITPMVRILDRIVEAPTAARLELDREKLELDKTRSGLSDDIKSESGIALLPAVDDSILDGAIPDPDQPQNPV